MDNSINSEYRWPNVAKGGRFFITTSTFYKKSDDPVAKVINDSWTEDEMLSAKSVSLALPTQENGYPQKDELLRIFNNLPSLQYLALPADYLNGISVDVLKRLKSLRLGAPSDEAVLNAILSRKEYLLPEVHFEALELFDFYLPIKFIKNFDLNLLDKLVWAGMELENLDKPGASVRIFDGCENFAGFELRSIKSADLLGAVRKDISALYLWSITAKKFEFERLNGFKQMKYLWINGFSGIFDFASLSELDQLQEITLTSFKGFKNLDLIKAMKKLKLLRISHLDESSVMELREICNKRSIEFDPN